MADYSKMTTPVTDDIWYELASTDKVKELEQFMINELSELKNEVEENEIAGITKSVSSVPIPKDPNHFKKERQMVMNRAMQVCEAKPLSVQANIMETELKSCYGTDYGVEGMPLLLHQFFIDRMHQLVQCKHLHMLRWRRFCEHTNTIEALYPFYQDRLTVSQIKHTPPPKWCILAVVSRRHIMAEYNDYSQRAQRLAPSREAYLLNKGNAAITSVNAEDMLIYLRWLVCHLHSMKKCNQYLRILQWLPTLHKYNVTPNFPEQIEEEDLDTARIPSKYNDDFGFGRPLSASHSRSGSASGSSSVRSNTSESTQPPTPPPFNAVLQTTNPLPASQLALVAAASGGGIASDESNQGLPVNNNDLEYLRPYLVYFIHLYDIEIDVEKINTSADEMELYAAVNRKFRQVFMRQEHMKIFKTYDTFEPGQENWGSDHSIHALKVESNWLPYISLKPDKDPAFEKKMMEFRKKDNVDELLRVMARFISVSDSEKVQETLRSHTVAVREPINVQPVSVTSHRTAYNTGVIWKRIYTNPELYHDQKDELDLALEEFDERGADKVRFDRKSRSQSARKRKDSYDYVDTVQLLGLDEGVQDSNDPASIQGAFLSFLQLRHLRIRDLQRTALSILNYFRSVERTIVINDEGLSHESGHFKRTSPQNHRKGINEGGVGGGGGLGSHHYMHNTPRDFKISETEFMEFSEVENHDDFYVMEEGRVHVQDQRGYYVIYDTALDDLKTLEKDMMLIATHFIEKDRDMRNATGVNRSDSARRKRVQSQAGDFDIPSYGHQELDRFAILMDIWAQQVAFMECKKELMDCYIEAYQHVFDRDEKRSMAQVITNLMYRFPRIDFNTNYFVKCYRLECICLRLQTQLVKGVLDTQIQEQREYIQKVCRDGDKDFGLPHAIIPKQPISINMSSSEWSEDPMPRSALRNVYMLEFHPSLAVASRIPDCLKHAYWELYHMHRPESVTEKVILEKNMLEVAIKEWEQIEPLGHSYTAQIQKDIFADVFVEDPLFMCEIAQTLVMQYEETAARKSQKDKIIGLTDVIGKVMEVVTSRYRLMDAAWETEILSDIYRKLAIDMGYDECHLFLRSVAFEFANPKKDAGKPPPLFITAVQEDDVSVDRLVPKSLCLAIHELDESHVGAISFRSRDKLLQIMKGDNAENLQTILATQILHKNALISAVQQAGACQPVKERAHGKRASSPDTKSEKSSATAMTGLSSATAGTAIGTRLGGASTRNKKAPEAFVSMQLEKLPSRDLMLNDFLDKKKAMGTVLRNADKLCELKRKLINDFCIRFHDRIAQYSLRSQIIAYYNSMLGLLEDFPNIRDTYFVLGDINEKKPNLDTEAALTPDARTLKKRARRVLSDDGKALLNLWFIPHYTELLIMYKTMADSDCKKALTFHLRIVSALHDIIQYLCAHARLGSSHARLGSQKIDFVSADWGGTEGIGADLREIQKQIDHLPDKANPEQTCEFLSLRRDVMFLEFDAAVRHSMKDTFLATGNKPAFKAITDCMHYALYELSNAQRHSFNSVYLNVPEPLEARDIQALNLYPWRTFMNRDGPFPVIFWQWQQIEYNMQLCLAGLKAVDKHVANGEILGVSLLMEDVLMSGQQDKAVYDPTENEDDNVSERGSGNGGGNGGGSNTPSVRGSRPASALSVTKKKSKDPFMQENLNRTNQPIESYKLLKNFLLLWKRLEVFKNNWGKSKLYTESINTPTLYNNYCKEYKKDILYPVLCAVARRYGQAELYEGMVSDSEALIMPKGVSEMEIRVRQLLKLLETLECHMISEVRKKINRSINLALSERAREESALPTDLWKKPVIKESFTINKPHIAEQFIEKLLSGQKQENDQSEITFNKEHLNKCLSSLASEVMIRERHNFENYSMYYENLLRVNHQLLYQKEQEVKQIKDQLKSTKENTLTEVQCQMADISQDMLLEITALRAKVSEMREQTLTQEGEIREKVREEYDALVHNLFAASFDLKKKFDEFREEIHDDIFEKITETRRETTERGLTTTREGLDSARSRGSAADDPTNDESRQREITHSERVRDIQHENHNLAMLLMKIKSMNTWKSNRARGVNEKMVTAYKKNSDKSKKELLETRIIAEEQVILLRQQLVALRNALKMSEHESDELRKELDKELKSKKEKSHAAQQKAQSQKQLEEARRSNIDKLIDELEEKELKLRKITVEQDKTRKMQQLTTEKVQKNATLMKKQLNHERNLKLDAFNRVDELQTTIYDIESLGVVTPTPQPIRARPQTAIGTMQTRSRGPGSAKYSNRGSSVGGAAWPPSTPWPANRSATPTSASMIMGGVGDVPNNLNDYPKKIQRPKTTTGRLRSRIAEQLLNELEPPDHHETILKLRELQALKQEKVLF